MCLCYYGNSVHSAVQCSPREKSIMEENEVGEDSAGQSASVSVNQPSTDSDIKEERIAARRKRVRAKIEADKRAALGEQPIEVDIDLPLPLYCMVVHIAGYVCLIRKPRRRWIQRRRERATSRLRQAEFVWRS